MSGWTFSNPVRVHFGEGVFDGIGAVVGGRSFVLVTHPDPSMLPWAERVAELCGAPALTFNGIDSNPSLDLLQQLTAQMGAAGVEPEVIVALGGGSVMDSAKFLAAARGRYQEVLAYLETGKPLPGRPLPIIAIPTTAGTGSDLTKWATVWDTSKGRKLSLEHDDLYAEAALIDPLLMASLPWSITLSSGLDALSHALESIWNVNASPITRGLAVRAARDLIGALRDLRGNLGNRAARARMALGALQAGLAFSNTRTAVAHNISYPLTLNYGVPHGIACSFCLPEVMDAAIGADSDCDAALEEIFGPLPQASTRLRALLSELNVPDDPRAFGIHPGQWSEIVESAFAGPRGRNFIGAAERFAMPSALPADDGARS